MRGRFTIAARSGALLSGLALAALAGPAWSQPQDDDAIATVRSYLDDGAATHTDQGHRALNREMIRTIDADGSMLWPVQVRSGRTYVFYAACDNFCSDVDMEVYDVDGRRAEVDILPDDTPFVQLSPAQSGRAYVRVWLASCDVAQCTVGARGMYGGRFVDRRSAPMLEVAPTATDWPEVTLALLNEYGQRHLDARFTALASEGDEIAPFRTESEGMTRSFALASGRTYRFQAACDQDCNDVDIEILSADGAQVALNEDFDNNPFVEFTPEADGPFTVRVYLPQATACTIEPCYIGLRGYEQR
ncbi:MAG: hypothetical protein GC206_12780 [Alphaproteobacteria bacterium]|nr:hypothetical protein [Alphaproteobacteria bacterium]